MKKKLYVGIGILIAGGILLEALFSHPHYDTWWHTVPGADVVLGFAGCWVLILLAKKILYPPLRRSEDYYEKTENRKGGGKA